MTICSIFFIFFYFLTFSSSSKSGPYQLVVQNVFDHCDTTTKPLTKKPLITSQCRVYSYNTTDNTTLVDINFTLLEDLRNWKLMLKLYYVRNGKKRLFNFLDNISCKNFLFPTLVKLWGYKPWDDYCNLPKGTYALKALNYDQASHLWKKTEEYGVMLYKGELVKGSETIVCSENWVMSVPAAPIVHKVRKKP